MCTVNHCSLIQQYQLCLWKAVSPLGLLCNTIGCYACRAGALGVSDRSHKSLSTQIILFTHSITSIPLIVSASCHCLSLLPWQYQMGLLTIQLKQMHNLPGMSHTVAPKGLIIWVKEWIPFVCKMLLMACLATYISTTWLFLCQGWIIRCLPMHRHWHPH